VLEATGRLTDIGPKETLSIMLSPGEMVLYSREETRDALELALRRLGLKATLTRSSICG